MRPWPAADPLCMRISPFFLVIAVSTIFWAVLFALFPAPRQDFPLWDDFAFSQGAFLFAHGDGIRYLQWASMPQLGQWLWAAPFLWLLGPSQPVLRLSTIVLSWLGLWGFYDLLRQESFTPGKAALATGALALNPYFFVLQGTFMTDVPALGFSLLALAFYGRAFTRRRIDVLALALIWALLAVSTRQNTLVVPIVAGVLLFKVPSLRFRPLWLASVIFPLFAGLAICWWFYQRTDIWPITPTRPTFQVLILLPFVLLHLGGLSALPVLALNPRPPDWKRYLTGLVLMLAYAAYWWSTGGTQLYGGGLFPYWPDMITPWGMYGAYAIGKPPLALGSAARIALSLAGCLGGAALLTRLLDLRLTKRAGPLLLFGLLQVPLLLAVPFVCDRHMVMLLPAALYLAAEAPRAERTHWSPALALVGVFGLASITLEHDWLSASVARWTLGRRALATMKPQELEGGVNWDGWHTPSPRPRDAALAGCRQGRLVEWFPQITGRYALAYSRYVGATIIDREPYTLWLPHGRWEMVLLRQPNVEGRLLAPPGPRSRWSEAPIETSDADRGTSGR